MDANGWLQRYNAQRLEELDYDGGMEMDRNRDWGANFNQAGGRTAYDYGRSGPIEPMAREPRNMLHVGIIAGAVVFVPLLWAFGW